MFSFSSISRDTKNLISNNLILILITIALLAVVVQFISIFLSPNRESLILIAQFVEQTQQRYGSLNQNSLAQMINSLSQQELQALVSAMMSYVLNFLLTFLIVTPISMGCMISLLANIVHNQFSFATMLNQAIRFIPKIFLFLLVTGAIGFIAVIILAMIPIVGMLVIFALMIFYECFFMAFLAVIIDSNNTVITQIKTAFTFFKKEKRLIIPMLIICFLILMIINVTFSPALLTNIVVSICLNLLSLLVNFFALCYIYRLYTLSNQQNHYDSCN